VDGDRGGACRAGERSRFADDGDGDRQTSLIIATIMPIKTNATIAACIQIQLAGMAPDSVLATIV
jgi:hypothetical protein